MFGSLSGNVLQAEKSPGIYIAVFDVLIVYMHKPDIVNFKPVAFQYVFLYGSVRLLQR